MTIPILHPHQLKADAEIVGAWDSGHKNVVYVLPTGGGKSINVSYDVARDAMNGVADVTIAHRQELVGQMSLHVARAGVKHRIIGPSNVIANITAEHRREFGRSYIDPDARSAVAGIDTLKSRFDDLKEWGKQVGKWRIDEAHHVLRANKWGVVDELFPNALGLGVTASPQRPDGQGLGRHSDGLFDHMVLGPGMRELIDMGYLTDYQFVIPISDYPEDLPIGPSGEITPKSMKEASEKSQIVGDVVVNYCKFAYGKQAIVFATDVETSTKMAQRFNMFGISAASVSANTPDDVRSEYVRRFRAGLIRVLVNVDLFGEGFDLPAIEVVIMARPTNSLVVYLQQIGRALRLLSGKFYGLIIDHVSNFKRHGFPDKPRNWSLDRRDKRAKRLPDPDEVKKTSCLKCYKPFDAVYRCCPYCNEPVPTLAPAGGGGRNIEQVDGDLMLLDASVLAEMRKAIKLPSPADVGNRAGFMAGGGIGTHMANKQVDKIAAQQELGQALDLWAGQRVAMGETVDVAYRRLYLATGSTVFDLMHKDRTTADYNASREMVEGWMK